jgi:UDP-glucose 6-dehydrogenase
VHDADAAVLVTEWDEFRRLDLAQMASLMQQPILVDGPICTIQRQLAA